SPREVYRQPRNRFVAEFVGTNNIFHGEVTQRLGAAVRIRTAAGAFDVRANGQAFQRGDAATFVICADRIATSFEGGVGANKVTAWLRGEEFVGSVVTLFLELSDGSELKIQKQESQLATINPKLGDSMTAFWDASEAFLLPE